MRRGGGALTTHVLFDFFGTLVAYSASRVAQGYERSYQLLQRAGAGFTYERFLALWSETFAELDARSARDHREFSMLELAHAFLRRALDSSDEALARDFVALYLEEWNRGVSHPPELPELLERLGRRFALAIVTNTHDPRLVPDHLERMGVAARFERVVTSVEFGLRKPAPAIFEHALRELGATREGCVYVGDSYDADYCGARAAGLRGFLIDPARRAPVPDADRIGSLPELEERLTAAADLSRA